MYLINTQPFTTIHGTKNWIYSKFDLDQKSRSNMIIPLIQTLTRVKCVSKMLWLCFYIPIIQGLVQNSLIIFQKQEQIMVYSISDFKVLQHGIPLMKISNYLHCLCLKRK